MGETWLISCSSETASCITHVAVLLPSTVCRNEFHKKVRLWNTYFSSFWKTFCRKKTNAPSKWGGTGDWGNKSSFFRPVAYIMIVQLKFQPYQAASTSIETWLIDDWLVVSTIWKIFVKMGSSSPNSGVKIKEYLSCHHLDECCYVSVYVMSCHFHRTTQRPSPSSRPPPPRRCDAVNLNRITTVPHRVERVGRWGWFFQGFLNPEV